MSGGRKFVFLPPGEGTLDQVGIVRALRSAGFDGVLSLELDYGTSNPKQAARDNVPYMRQVLSSV